MPSLRENLETAKGKKKRKSKQKAKERYAKAREDAQLAGVIETTPVGAVRDEVVNPLVQEEQETLSLDRKAIQKGWAVPEQEKQAVVGRLIEKIHQEETSAAEVAMCSNAVLRADQMQYERDHPKEAGEAKGGTKVGVVVQNQINLSDLFKQVDLERERLKALTEVKEVGFQEALSISAESPTNQEVE